MGVLAFAGCTEQAAVAPTTPTAVKTTNPAAADLALVAGYRISTLLVLIDLGLVPDFSWQNLTPLAAIRY